MKTAIASPAGAAPVFVEGADVCDVQMTVVDALSAGHTLRALARDKKTPHGTRELLNRVGAQMVSAANAKAKQRRGGQ